MTEYLPREQVNCDICHSAEFNVVCEAQSLYSSERFNLVRCKNCSLIYVNPRQQESAKLADLRKVSEEAVFEKMQDRDEEIFKHILDEIGQYCSSGHLLDVGCASGGLLREAKKRGYRVSGVEVNQRAAQCAITQYALDVRASTLEEACWPESHFDVIILVNTIEHLYHPSKTVTEIFRILKPGGYFYCVTPDFYHYATRFMQFLGWMKNTDRIDPTGHPYHFVPGTLAELIRRQGFTILKCGSPITGLCTRRDGTIGWKRHFLRTTLFPGICLSQIFPIGSTIRCIAQHPLKN